GLNDWRSIVTSVVPLPGRNGLGYRTRKGQVFLTRNDQGGFTTAQLTNLRVTSDLAGGACRWTPVNAARGQNGHANRGMVAGSQHVIVGKDVEAFTAGLSDQSPEGSCVTLPTRGTRTAASDA